MPNYMMITKDPEDGSIYTSFHDAYPEQQRMDAEVCAGCYVEIYERSFDDEIGMNNYVRAY